MALEKHYTVSQVADSLNVTARTVRELIREGRLKAVKLKKEYRIPESSLEKFQE